MRWPTRHPPRRPGGRGWRAEEPRCATLWPERLSERLCQQLAFCLEADKVKKVPRRNPLTDGGRRENHAEHMWRPALMAVVLAENSIEPVDL